MRLPRAEHQARFMIPWDLTEWAEKDVLRRWVADEVSTFDWQHPSLATYIQKHSRFRPRELLCLCGYAYATAVFDSEDILHQWHADPVLRQTLAAHSFTTRDITAFRKHNSGLIRWVLTQVLKRAVRDRYEVEGLIPAGLRRLLEQNAAARVELARHMDRAAQGA